MKKLAICGLLAVALLIGFGYFEQVRDLNAASTLSVDEMGQILGGGEGSRYKQCCKDDSSICSSSAGSCSRFNEELELCNVSTGKYGTDLTRRTCSGVRECTDCDDGGYAMCYETYKCAYKPFSSTCKQDGDRISYTKVPASCSDKR